MKNKKSILLFTCLLALLILLGITINIFINYKITKYIILSNSEVYNLPKTITVKKGEKYGDLPILTKENYIFIGWSTTSEGKDIINSSTIVGNEDTIYPIFHLEVFNLSIDPNGGNYLSSPGIYQLNIKYNQTTIVEDSIRVGYDFNGWTVIGNSSTITDKNFIMGTEDTELIANWTVKKYNLTIDCNGGQINNENSLKYSVAYNDSIPISNPTREGYIFSGYSIDGGEIIESKFKMTDAKDSVLKANWIKNDDTSSVNYYVYNYLMDTNGSSYTLSSIDFGTTLLGDTINPDTHSYEGFTSPDVQTINITENKNYIIEYKYTRNKYNLTINYNMNTKSNESLSLYYGETIDLNIPLNNGYNFKNWTSDNGKIINNEFTMPLLDSVINASWNPIVYYISYDLNGGNSNELKYTYTINDNISLPKPYKAGFDFIGWTISDSDTPNDNMSIIHQYGNLYFKANYDTAKYQVLFDDNNGNISSKKITLNTSIGELPIPKKEGCSFIGWFTDKDNGEQINDDTIITQNITYYAHWNYYAVGKLISEADNENLKYDGTSDNNLRYVGANPNNYVQFNNETWRIIGVMRNIKDSQNNSSSFIKIVRANSIGQYSWDSSDTSINRGYGINEWSQADLMTELNSTYYNSLSSNCYNNTNNVSVTCDFSTIGLNSTSKSLIANVSWSTGTNGTNLWRNQNNGLTSNFYKYERSTDNGKICTNSDTCNDNIARTTIWNGNIGLIYLSDYGYAVNNDTCLNTPLFEWWNNSDCSSNNWLASTNEWTLSIASSIDYSYRVFYSGHSIETTAASLPNDVRPSLYLKDNILINSGSGTESDPYLLSLD